MRLMHVRHVNLTAPLLTATQRRNGYRLKNWIPNSKLQNCVYGPDFADIAVLIRDLLALSQLVRNLKLGLRLSRMTRTFRLRLPRASEILLRNTTRKIYTRSLNPQTVAIRTHPLVASKSLWAGAGADGETSASDSQATAARTMTTDSGLKDLGSGMAGMAARETARVTGRVNGDRDGARNRNRNRVMIVSVTTDGAVVTARGLMHHRYLVCTALCDLKP